MNKVTQRLNVTVEARPEKCSIDLDREWRRNQFKIKQSNFKVLDQRRS